MSHQKRSLDQFQDKKILVCGLGILGGGAGVVKTLLKLGAQVRITDLKTQEQLQSTIKTLDLSAIDKVTFGHHAEEDIAWADSIIKNPAVPTNSPFIQKALALNKHVTTEAALYLKYTSAFTIGITGTRGKTTTTMMTYELLRKGLKHQVLVGGNIQDKGCLPLLLEEDEETISVLELSSWALEGCHWEQVSPNIAVLTNLYADHLNRYQSIEEYAYDKAAIFQYQTAEDHAFLNTQHEWFEYYLEKVTSNLHLFDALTLPEKLRLRVSGTHNRLNAAAAFSVAKLMGIERDTITESLEQFKGVPYRQQIVGEKNGVLFINDSTSTTPTALRAALETYPTATFIIGGTSKELPVDDILPHLKRHQGKIYYLQGTGTNQLLQQLSFAEKPSIFTNLTDAFHAAVANTSSGEIVFSPGFTSFELFKNEFDRAEQFDKLVQDYLSHKE